MIDVKEKQIALVTGATGAIGLAIARQMADEGYEVVIVTRNENKAQMAVREIIEVTSNPHVRYELVDISRRVVIQKFAQRWEGPLHVLINNAAVTPHSREETSEGIELQFATNVLGYFWMTEAFRNIMSTSSSARIVDVASYWAGDLELDDLEFTRRRYSNGKAYRQSKQANRMLAVVWADQLKADGITINACHPGDVNSQLSNNLGFGGSQSPDQGADTPVWLAIDPSIRQKSGKFFAHRKGDRCRFGEDRQAVNSLFNICMQYTK